MLFDFEFGNVKGWLSEKYQTWYFLCFPVASLRKLRACGLTVSTVMSPCLAAVLWKVEKHGLRLTRENCCRTSEGCLVRHDQALYFDESNNFLYRGERFRQLR